MSNTRTHEHYDQFGYDFAIDKQHAARLEEIDEIKLGMQRLYEAFALGREDAVEMTKVWLADQLGRCVP